MAGRPVFRINAHPGYPHENCYWEYAIDSHGCSARMDNATAIIGVRWLARHGRQQVRLMPAT